MDIYSERNKNEQTELIYHYFPLKARNQIIHLWRDFFNQAAQARDNGDSHRLLWEYLENLICKAHGHLTLDFTGLNYREKQSNTEKYFTRLEKIEDVLDVIELSFQVIKFAIAKINYVRFSLSYSQCGIQLNQILQKNSLGFRFDSGIIIKIDNKLLDNEIVVKTIQLTSNDIFKNANQEFLECLNHLRNDRYKEAINDALKSFESTLKIICTQFNWEYDTTKDTSSKLIDLCLKNELIPSYLQSHFSGIRTTLESGIPTIRNKRTGHGQGPEEIKIPPSLAHYSIFLTGACINYLVDLFKEKIADKKS